MNETTASSAEHCDWEGAVAADDADGVAIRKYLRDRSLISDKELIVGMKLLVKDGRVDAPLIQLLVIDAVDTDSLPEILRASDTIILRKIELALSLAQFVGLFKRFSMTCAVPGLGPEEWAYLNRA